VNFKCYWDVGLGASGTVPTTEALFVADGARRLLRYAEVRLKADKPASTSGSAGAPERTTSSNSGTSSPSTKKVATTSPSVVCHFHISN
jgi:hypothetical protein